MSAASVEARQAAERIGAGTLPMAARVLLVGLGIFMVALLPRLIALDLFPTSDEDSWMRRTGGFTFGLVNAQYGRTYQNGHPGVTTMWIGLLSQGPEGALRFADRVHGLRIVAQVPGYLEGLAQARVGFAVLGALGAAVAALLTWRLFGTGPGVLAGLALAAEPFLVANQQLVHVDGPLVTFVVVAALAAIVRFAAGGGIGYVLLAGVSTGLALLSKTPALFLAGFVPLVALGGALLAGLLGGNRALDSAPQAAGTRVAPAALLARPILDLVLWAALAAGTFFALWPALWALGPAEVFSRIVEFTEETGGQPDEVGSFFLGQIGADPGPLYYVVSTALRLSLFTTVGLVVAAVLTRKADPAARLRAGWVLLFALGFSLMMTLGPKKFDRYLLPAFPALVILAALGWWLLLARLRGPAARVGLGAALAVLLAFPLLWVYPYPLAYYNPLLGGGAAAQRSVMIGNGEGLDQAASWLNAQPNTRELRVSAHSWDILAALTPADGEPLRDGIPDDADYIVTYGRRIQMQRWGESLDRYLAANPPVYVVRINGIEYVHIHPGPQRGQQP